MAIKWLGLGCAVLLGACQGGPVQQMKTVPQADLGQFMGNWYVIANIPPFIEKDAQNSIESYRRDADGTVDITFTWQKDGDSSADKRKTLKSRGFILDETNALWGVKFWFWPAKADYRIVYIAPDYSQTVVAREKRDYVWIMARTPTIPDADYARLLQVVASQGYDMGLVQKVSQKWN